MLSGMMGSFRYIGRNSYSIAERSADNDDWSVPSSGLQKITQ